jgi:hypothetical protein
MDQNFFGHSPQKRLPHPSHSLNVSPSDFDLFEKVKSALIDRQIPDEIDQTCGSLISKDNREQNIGVPRSLTFQ